MQVATYGDVEPSEFLTDYSVLREGKDSTWPTLIYLTPDKAKVPLYKKSCQEPVWIWRGAKSDAKDLDKEDSDYVAQCM
ncbi:MAG TPA: hypothetical protein PKD12_22225 [Nitrospira sp.]|nr:hypothetical protein [Nitrospira sp.]